MTIMTHEREVSCDFCSNVDTNWIYPVDDFTQQMDPASNENYDVHMLGSWAACDDCHELIEEEHREQLVLHSLDSYGVPRDSKVYPAIKSRIERLHDEFFFHRSGAATHESENVIHDDYEPGIVRIEVHKL